MNFMKAVILAGGKGTRLASTIKDVPKALVGIGEKPVIEYQVSLLEKNGIKEVWMLLGYLGKQIRDYFGKRKGSAIIRFSQEESPLGTAGAIKLLEGKIKDDFLVLSGDVMLDFDVKRFVKWHRQKKGLVSIVVHPNDHPFDSDLVETNKDGQVINLLKKPHPEGEVFRNLSVASVYIFSPEIFKYIPVNEKLDIEKDIMPKLLEAKEKIYAYSTPEYIKDMGTPERLEQVVKDYLSGKIKKFNLRNKRKAVFLDRDGVLNEQIDRIIKKEDMKVYSFSAEAVRMINNSDFLAIVATNQPLIAKGFLTEKGLEEIHKKLETELGMRGAKIDAIYYCPHHPEKGFEGEVPELKIKCKCRKPGTSLILKAKKDLNIDLKKSFFIGDRTTDILAGKRAGCKTILVETGLAGKDGKVSVKPDFSAKNLLEAVKIIR